RSVVDAEAGRDAAVGLVEAGVDGPQGLESDHRGGIGEKARHGYVPFGLVWRSVGHAGLVTGEGRAASCLWIGSSSLEPARRPKSRATNLRCEDYASSI